MAKRRDPATLRGSIVPLVTPFTADGAFDETAFAESVEPPLCEPPAENQAGIETVLNGYGLLQRAEVPS